MRTGETGGDPPHKPLKLPLTPVACARDAPEAYYSSDVSQTELNADT
jgi:hypothetical protein